MKVKEMIEILKQLNGEHEVVPYFDPHWRVHTGFEIKGQESNSEISKIIEKLDVLFD